MSGQNDKGKPLTRKPSFKNRKPPEIRQTLTSKYRLLKSNPLLMKAVANTQEDKDILFNKPLKVLANAMGNNSDILNGKLSVPNGSAMANSLESVAPKPPKDVKRKVEILAKPKTSFNHSNSSKIEFTTDQILSSTIIESKRESIRKMGLGGRVNQKIPSNKPLSRPPLSFNKGPKQEINNKPSTSKFSQNQKPTSSKQTTTQVRSQSANRVALDNKNQKKPSQSAKPQPLRRSLSAEHFDKKKKEMFEQLRICNVQPRKSQSFQNISIKNDEKEKPNKTEEVNFLTITEEGSNYTTPSETPTPKFKTPIAYNRRSIKTPNTTNNRRSMFLSTPRADEMSERLNDWLKRRGKSLGDFHHLKCFGIHGHNNSKVIAKVDSEENEENKENVEPEPKDDSYEELKIIVPENIKKNEETEGVDEKNNLEVEKKKDILEVEKKKIDVEVVAKGALQDLHKLILEGYSCDQCEVWLKLIKQKYNKLEEDPQYWECRAAIEQSKGNINLAVECYKTAIVQGAEIQAVDESLDQLLQKFSLLNINNMDTNTQERARIVQDARNIFKSSIIQFAVQERILKTKNKEGVTIERKLVATPVRRSTRLSRSAYTSTPGIKIYSSLLDVDHDMRNSIDFRHNKALK